MFDGDIGIIQEAESKIAKLCYYAARKMSKYQYSNEQKSTPSLGVIRLDYDYPPALGDIDCPESFPYPVYYKVVPGFTFEIFSNPPFQNGNLDSICAISEIA